MGVLTHDAVRDGAGDNATHAFAQPDAHPPRVHEPLAISPVTAPGLAAHETAYQLASGLAFRLSLFRVPPPEPGWHVIHALAVQIDPATGAEIGTPLPPHRHATAITMLADGRVTLAGIRAELVQQMGERFVHHTTEAALFDALPLLPGADAR